MNSFKQFNFQTFLYEALSADNFTVPTKVQEWIIPLIQKGKNVIGQSQTGTGKTHAFLLPLVDKIDTKTDGVQAVITAPSRELATQIYQVARRLTSFSESTIRVVNFVGGTDKARQIKRLKSKQPHIVVGTPGRLLDLVREQALFIHTSSVFVVDEADMTLDMGFLKEVDQLASHLPAKLQMLIFSATIPEKLKPFLKKYMENPVHENIAPKEKINAIVDNWLISTKGEDIKQVIYQLLTISYPYLAIVFANTKARVIEISDFLKAQSLKVATLHGDVSPRERKRVMKQVANLEYQYLIATDLAARGIDIGGVSHVINAEIPKDLSFFIHRVGRTGRGGLSGIAITLYAPESEASIQQIEELEIEFKPKTIKNGEIIDSYDRNQRKKRKIKQEKLDVELLGLIKKKRKNIKPSYKKKIQRAIKDSNKQKRKLTRRSTMRAARKIKK
ncbi:MAG: DEAD/DEAH box helicase [Streptococcaceae bacterium]|nr:DEAD/DEAH box helicase [Streptococcaceae bacterium]